MKILPFKTNIIQSEDKERLKSVSNHSKEYLIGI
jgi:hypothetical protein